MANRDFKDVQSNYRDVKEVHLKVSIGATGAPTLDSFSAGYASIVRNGTGDYTITMAEGYSGFLNGLITYLDSTTADFLFQWDSINDSTSAFGFRCIGADGSTAVEDPANGSTLYITLWLRNSSVK